uniref:FAD-dependent oxidoreductase n=1 Tax=Thermorudis sp. TaxID=1969470 RepID=A0A7C3ANX0_9BACT
MTGGNAEPIQGLPPVEVLPSLSDRVYAALKQSIADQRLKPGSKLSVPRLAAALGVSRTPVKEALERLAQDGLVTMLPNRGAYVAILRWEDVEEIYQMREMLEGLATRLAAARMDDELLARLRDLLQQGESAVRRRDIEAHIKIDLEFHRLIRARGGNRRLVRALELAVRRQGVRVVSGAAVVEVLREGGRVRGVRTLLGDVPASAVVLAAGSWSGQIRGTMLDLPVVPQRGQILAVWRGALELRRVILAPGDPYLVPRRDGRMIVGATRELVGYDPSLTVEGVGWLLSSAERLVPGVRSASIAEMWTGFRPFSPDGRPVIGRGRLDGLYYATGHGANGITLAPGTARVVASMLRGEAPPVPVDAFSPLRFG